MPNPLPYLAALFLVGMTAYLAGMWTTYKDWIAWRWLDDTREAAQSIADTGYVLRPVTYHARRPGQPSERHVVRDAARIAPGYLLINRSANPEPAFVADLVDETGRVVHSWPIDHSKVIAGGAPDEFVHAVLPLPDGSILANFDQGFGMARFDTCGDPVWTRTDMVFHHSLTPDPDRGGVWTWTAKLSDDGQDQQMTRIDPETGETLESIDLIDDVIERDPEARLAFRIPEDFEWSRDAPRGTVPDIFHPNDVEPLPEAIADAFPEFEAGDLMISLRNINLVAVIDRDSHRLKWWQSGPWHMQHDPDFQADGTITVYSNKPDRDHSGIVEANLATGEFIEKFADGSFDFYSEKMGQHERLPNGNWTVTSPFEGRVTELTADGEIVREISNILDDRYNSLVTTAVHVPRDFFEALPKCPSESRLRAESLR